MALPDPKNSLIEELIWRGMLQDSTPGLAEHLNKGIASGYIGFDPTASSLHLGNLATIMLLVQLQKHGHRPIALVGGATGMIGDPSGKREERKLLDAETIEYNVSCIRKQLEAFLVFDDSPTGALMTNNYDWLSQISLIDFLRDVGKHLSVNYMMAKDSVKSRLETGISYTEFTYQLLQGYDYYHLHRHFGCTIQMGGSDQWGNITTGTELIRRMGGGDNAHGLTTPLLTKADGTKFGKSEQGNVWLDPARTSPYRFYQFLLNAADEDVQRLLYVYSLKGREALEALLAQHSSNPGARQAQRALAEELTTRIHGSAALAGAIQASSILFGQGTRDELATMPLELLNDVFEGVPTSTHSRSALDAGLALTDLLADGGALPSKGEAKKMIQGGGVRVNKDKVADVQHRVSAADLLAGRMILLQTGKKSYHLAIFE